MQPEQNEPPEDDPESGIEPLEAWDPYAQLRELRGKVKFSGTWQELKEDR